jgi:hypothetical protein
LSTACDTATAAWAEGVGTATADFQAANDEALAAWNASAHDAQLGLDSSIASATVQWEDAEDSAHATFDSDSASATADWTADESPAWDALTAASQGNSGENPPESMRRLPPAVPWTPGMPPQFPSPFDYRLPPMRWNLPLEPESAPPWLPLTEPFRLPGWMQEPQVQQHFPDPFNIPLPGGGNFKWKPGSPGNPFRGDPFHPDWRELVPRKYEFRFEWTW